MSAGEFKAVHELEDGAVVLTIHGQRPSVSADRLRRARILVTNGDVHAVVFTPWNTTEDQLFAPTETILLSQDALRRLPPELLADVSGAERFADPLIALLDVQWRLVLSGYRIRFEDAPALPDEQLGGFADWRLRAKGVLTMIDVNLALPLRGRYLAALQAAMVRGGLASAGVDTTALDLRRSPGGDDFGSLQVPAKGLRGAFAIDGALDEVGNASPIRRRAQNARRIPRGRVLRPAFKTAIPILNSLLGVPESVFAPISSLTGLDALLDEPVRVLLVGPRSGASAARQSRLQERLSDLSVRRLEVAGEAIFDGDSEIEGLPDTYAAWADVIVLSGTTLDEAPGVAFSDAPIVADFGVVDVLGFLMNTPRTNERTGALSALLNRADLVIAADCVQRDILLGALAGEFRINASVYDDDASLKSLVVEDPDLLVLDAFCHSPKLSADRPLAPVGPPPPKPSDFALIVQYMREGGISNVSKRALGRVTRLASQAMGRND